MAISCVSLFRFVQYSNAFYTGKTPWDTWVSCEEWEFTGQVYQVDPFNRRPPEKTTVGIMEGGRYEAFAYDDRNKTHPVFYVTEDQRNGPTRRFRPDPSIVDWKNNSWYACSKRLAFWLLLSLLTLNTLLLPFEIGRCYMERASSISCFWSRTQRMTTRPALTSGLKAFMSKF